MSFLRKVTRIITRRNFRIFTRRNSYFKKYQNSYIRWIRENPRIHPGYHFCDFPSKWHFRLTNEILEIAQNLAYAKRFGGGREISEMKRFLNFWVLHSPNSIFHGCTYSFVLNFDWLIEVEFEPPGTDSRAEVILEQSFWSKERRSWLWIQMRIWRFLRNRQNPGIKNHQAQQRNNICTKNIKRRV